MNNPLITICLLTHNSERFLEKTLKSVLGQTYDNFEILVSDNYSTDKTEQIIRSFQKKNNNIIFRKNIPNIKLGKVYDGCYDNCNGCLSSGLIKGKFVCFFHSDDIYEKTIVEKEVKFLMENPGAGAIFTLGNIIDRNEKVLGKFKLPRDLRDKNIHNFMEIFRAILKYGNMFLITPTFMARKEIFKKTGVFNWEDFITSGDLEMWLRIAEKYPIGILSENLINYRLGGGGKKYHNLRTEKADFFKVMDYFLQTKKYASKIDKKNIRQYEYQKYFDDTLRAMNFLKKNQINEAKKIINEPFSWEFFRAYLENMTMLRTKILTLRIILFFGINLGLGRYLGKILYKLRY